MKTEDKEDLLLSTPIRGSNQTAVRGFNERLVLHLIRQYGALTKAEATRATGLSPNAVSVIFKALEADGLLLRQAPIRGRVGQPSVPMCLNPDARHYVGLKVGRRSFDMVIADFTGAVVARRLRQHSYPTPDGMLDFIKTNLTPLLRAAGKKRGDMSGFSVAMPSELWHWRDVFDAPREEMGAWQDLDIKGMLNGFVPGPVTCENDGTAACRCELVFGPQNHRQDFIYFFAGTFIGGGIVLNGSVFTGRRGNSGGLGPLRIPDEPGGHRLIDHASLAVLERQITKAGGDPNALYVENPDWDQFEPLVGDWIARAGRSLGHAIVSTLAIIDFEAVIIDGAFPDAVRARLVGEVRRQMDQLDLQGVYRPEIGPGHFGSVARALGAAAHCISTDYMIDQNTLQRK
ncbi:ROK family transcriptional regulator [Martelella radicis]|uniref:Putative NBD/HSP70 family sugar kinase n=1 Tax=Martelella radicis TaxID=1397476 RepID=A0A7W6PAT9_9HYPH|nr:ROK family transcriptional regulator [Martelella radicis]MBB4123205.1 putative NBD/HSP70 family sugar kinase [Martelella radicis]